MSLFSNLIRRGTRASQPAATAVPTGTLYFVTDELVTERSSGSAWETYSDAGSGSAPTGAQYVTLATNGTLTAERVLTAGAGITLTDGGAGGNVTVKAPRTVTFTIDGGGSVIATGAKTVVGPIPYSGTITKVTALSADAAITSGSIVIDLWSDTYGNYPPTDADSITASAPVTISSATKSQDSTLTGWTTSVTAGAIWRANVDSVTSLIRVVVTVEIT